jgi:gamma-glutamyltranspeptidase / glutathione hydrolase
MTPGSSLGRAALAAALLAFAAPQVRAQPLPDRPPEAATGFEPKAAVHAQRFLVVAAHPLAARAGADVVARGGSALDAAIATLMVLNLVEPQSSGIGGGGFLLYWSQKERKVSAYDGRETAPAAATPSRFLDAGGKPLSWPDAIVSGRSVGVPGLLRMLELAHRRHGRLPWAALFEPAILLAESGFPMSPRLHALVAADRYLAQDDAARRYFYQPDGKPKPAGTVLRNPELAAVLRAVAARGADAFYRGDVARAVVAKVRAHPRSPGDLSETDLAGYAALERAPLCGPYRAWKVCGMPPPSSGGFALVQMLGILERLGIERTRPASLEAVHLFSEAGRLAYADRDRYIADPAFVAVPLAPLLDAGYLAQRARLVDRARSMGRAPAGSPPGLPVLGAAEALELPSTSHVSIVDAEGNAVAVTASIESAFGNRQMVRGFMLNNELTDFSWLPEVDGRAVANRVEPRKRPRSSMAPTLVFDAQGRLVLAVGSPGGHSIINYVAKTLVGVLDWGLDMQDAVSLPNFGSRNGPTDLEAGTDLERLVPGLRAMGHVVRVRPEASGLHGIQRASGGWTGGADPRREGTAIGE